jgi:hypothetical protein
MLGAPAGQVAFSMTTAKQQSKQAVPSDSPSDSQPPTSIPTLSSSRQPSAPHAVSVTPSTSDSADVWKLAYELFRKQESELEEDYSKQLGGNAAAIADLSSREAIQAILEKLLGDREKKQWRIPFPGHNIKIRIQVERLAKFLQWSDSFVKNAVSTQPYAALAWSGVSLLLPAST